MGAKPVYLIAGGRPSEAERLARDFRAVFDAFGAPNPTVAYVGTASLDNADFFQIFKGPMLAAGAAEAALVPIVGEGANIGAAKSMLSSADAVFLTGGEVEYGISWLKKTGLDAFLTGLYRGGKPFFGISAGAIMMGTHWVHWDVLGDDGTASLFECLGFVPMLFDAHGENEDWSELKCALRLLGPGAAGHGLSRGGFFSADARGVLTSYRNAPAVYRNVDGRIEPVK